MINLATVTYIFLLNYRYDDNVSVVSQDEDMSQHIAVLSSICKYRLSHHIFLERTLPVRNLQATRIALIHTN